MYGYIYLYKIIPTGKIYIGQHRSKIFDENYFGSGTLWKRAVKKYGKRFISRRIITWCDNQEDLNAAEIFYINYFNSTDKNIGYNIAAGGDIGPVTKLHKKHISKALIRNGSKKGKNNPMYGKSAYAVKGRIVVSKDNKELYITKDKLDDYLNLGYVKRGVKRRFSTKRSNYAKTRYNPNFGTKGTSWYKNLLTGKAYSVNDTKGKELLANGFVKGNFTKKEKEDLKMKGII